MPEKLSQMYENLTEEAQEEVYDFMMYLILKQNKTQPQNPVGFGKENRLSALKEFAGSGKKLWQGIDALEYQNGLREERVIV